MGLLTTFFLCANVYLQDFKIGGCYMDYEVLKFSNESLELEVNVSPDEDTVFLSQEQLALLYETSKQAISYHIKNILKDGELESSTIKKILTVQNEGGRPIKRNVTDYNLDMIISVGYRINTKKGISFRRWANSVLKEYLLKGYAINDERTLITKDNYLALLSRVDSLYQRVDTLENKEKHRFVDDVLLLDNQLFDAIVLITKMIETAHDSIVLIDPYVDAISLSFFKNKKAEIKLVVVTSSRANIGRREISSFSDRYGVLQVKIDNKFHDRYLILDNELFYHLGSSINYIGKRLSQITLIKDNDIISALKNRVDSLLEESA